MRFRQLFPIVVAVALLGASRAEAQFRGGVGGMRGPRWATTVQGRVLQVALLTGLGAALLGMLRPQLRRKKRGAKLDAFELPEIPAGSWPASIRDESRGIDDRAV